MRRRAYSITLREPVILSQDTATTGHHRCLDYISGRALLGLAAASCYATFEPEEAWRVFHSGEVRFGDGLPLTQGHRALPTPRTFHTIKGHTDGAVLNTATLKERPVEQLQRLGGGYVTVGSEEYLRRINPSRTRAVKTAIDSSTLSRAREGALFSYEALSAGQQFVVVLEAEDDIPEAWVDRIEEALVGHRRLGRSRGAEFGAVTIEVHDDTRWAAEERVSTNRVIIALLSDLIVQDPEGAHAHPVPKPNAFGLPESWELDLEGSAITHRLVDQFNGHRRSFSMARQVICRGGVLAYHGDETVEVLTGERRVGLDTQEGKGHVALHPGWLRRSHYTLRRDFLGDEQEQATVACPDPGLARWLRRRQPTLSEEAQVAIDTEAKELAYFCRTHSRAPSPTQWSRIRQWAGRQPEGTMRKASLSELLQGLRALVGGTVGVLSRGWEIGYPSPQDEELGRYVLSFGKQYGAHALSELAHLVRVHITHTRRHEEETR